MGNFTLKHGTQVVPQFPHLNMKEDLFPNAEKFDPAAHFLDQDGNLRKVEEYIPFSLGKRMCPGEGLARLEMFLIMANLIRQFYLHAGDPLPDFKAQQVDVNPQPQSYEVLVEIREDI